MKRFLLTIFLSICFLTSSFATHIVGGEMDIQVVKGQSDFTHQLNLNLYFDEALLQRSYILEPRYLRGFFMLPYRQWASLAFDRYLGYDILYLLRSFGVPIFWQTFLLQNLFCT
jgi:hypothetical protein